MAAFARIGRLWEVFLLRIAQLGSVEEGQKEFSRFLDPLGKSASEVHIGGSVPNLGEGNLKGIAEAQPFYPILVSAKDTLEGGR